MAGQVATNKTRSGVWIASIVVTACISAIITFMLVRGGNESPTRSLPGVPGDVESSLSRALDQSQPLMPSGVEVSLDEAVSHEPSLALPSSGVPEGEKLELWFNPTTNEVAARYGSTLVIEFDPWESKQNPAEEYSSEANSWKAGYTTAIGQSPAWVIPANSRTDGQPPLPVVHVARDGLDVTLFGKMPLDQLLEVSGSLVPATASQVPGGTA